MTNNIITIEYPLGSIEVTYPLYKIVEKKIKRHWWSRKKIVYLVTSGHRKIYAPVYHKMPDEVGISIDLYMDKMATYKSVVQWSYVNEPGYSETYDIFFLEYADAEDFMEWLLSLKMINKLVGEDNE